MLTPRQSAASSIGVLTLSVSGGLFAMYFALGIVYNQKKGMEGTSTSTSRTCNYTTSLNLVCLSITTSLNLSSLLLCLSIMMSFNLSLFLNYYRL